MKVRNGKPPRRMRQGDGAARVCELVALKVSDIGSTRMMLRVEQGKGH